MSAFYDRETGALIPADATAAEEAVIRGGVSPSGGPLGVRMGSECQCHTHREWVPLHVHHVWPSGMGGPDEESNRVTVCANAHYSVHSALDLLLEHDGAPPAEDWRRYGWKVRRLARRGYDRWRAAQ